jgi:glycosyltransferase involved in cell wall biosynthesis
MGGLSPMPTASVIVPNYNHARFLRRRIDTILAQTFQDFELILLDDCSTDESRSILREYASDLRVRLEFNEVNSGSPFKQWNKGIRLARGKYVWIAESDDYAHERLLERLVAVLEADPKVAFGYSRSRCVDENSESGGFSDFYLAHIDSSRWSRDFCVDGREECRNYFVCANPVPNASAVVFRRDVYEKVGRADETLRYCGDWKLWAAMALEGSVAYVSEPLNYFRFHAASVRNKSSDGAVDVTEALQVIRWILDRVTPPDAVLQQTYRTHADLWVPLVLSPRVPASLRSEVLQRARAVDPRPLRRAIRPALMMARLKVRRHWRGLRSMLASTRTSP